MTTSRLRIDELKDHPHACLRPIPGAKGEHQYPGDIDVADLILLGHGDGRSRCGTISMMEHVDGRTLRFVHRRPELLGLAADYVLEHGLAELRLRAVASAIGVSHRTLLHHFPSKEFLLAEVLRELRARDRSLMAAEAERLASTPPGNLTMALWRQLRTPESMPYWRLFFEAYGLAVADPGRYAPFIDGLVEDWVQLAVDMMARAGVPTRRRRRLATLTVASVRGLLLDLLVTGDTARVDAAAKELAATLQTAIPSAD